MPTCADCGGTVIEYDTAAGNGFCVKCGTIIEENTMVNEVTFGETSSGGAMVQGAYVGQGSTHARMTGPFGNRASNESREQTIANASKKIQGIANVMHLSDVVCLAATRLYTLAVEHKFTKGRKSMNVIAVCLYITCRQKEMRNYMLIDFSDLLQVNVFELGHTYLQLIQTLNLRLPLVDPSHYISRFAALLEFGDETHAVAHEAVRLVQRFDRDWMTKGRRPAGICGAALLLAARMNNFRRSVEEIVQVVKIADTTLRKRLEEFRQSPSGNLTLEDFRSVWLEEEMDPPAFTKGKEKEEKERLKREGVQVPEKGKGKQKVKGKRKRVVEDDEDEDDGRGVQGNAPMPAIDPSLFNEGILAGTITPLFVPEYDDPDLNIDPALLPTSPSRPPSTMPTDLSLPPTTIADETASIVLSEEVATFLQNTQGSMLSSALDEAERRRREAIQSNVSDELLGLDDEELDRFLLTEEEVRVKERVWVELNKDYLEAIAAKGERQESASELKSRKRRKTNGSNKPRDRSTPSGSTAAESVRNLLKKNSKYSKRINYDALKDLFVPGPTNISGMAVVGEDDKDDDGLYRMSVDDKSDGEEIVIEGTGGVGMAQPSLQTNGPTLRVPGIDGDGDASDKEDEVWEDPYEQEV